MFTPRVSPRVDAVSSPSWNPDSVSVELKMPMLKFFNLEESAAVCPTPNATLA